MTVLGSLAGSLGGGGVIGGAVVRLFLDDGQYKAALSQAEVQGKTATTGIGASLSKMKVLGAAAFAVLGTAAVKYGIDAVAAAREHEVAVTELTAAVGENAAMLGEQATALQMVTGFSDEAIMSADTILSRFQLSADQLKELNPLILDYARAMGIDASTAASNFGKALLGNTRAIKSIGGEFTATGNKTKDLAALMQILQEKVGGVAVEFGKTSAGQAAILNQRFDEIKETVGAGLLPLIQALKETFVSLAPILEKIGSVLKVVFVGLAGAVYLFEDALAGVATVADHVLGPLYDFDGSMSHLSDNAAQLQGILDGTSTSVDGLGRSAAVAGEHAESMAHKAKKAAREFAKEIKSNFDIAGQSAFGFKAKIDGTVRAFRTGLHNMAEQLHELRKAMNTLDDAHIGDNVKKFLLEQGPGAVARFADANKKGRDDIVATIKDIISTQNDLGHGIDNTTSKVQKLGHTNAHSTITLEYKIAGIDPRTLPGVGSHP